MIPWWSLVTAYGRFPRKAIEVASWGDGSSWYWISQSIWWSSGKDLTVHWRCPIHTIGVPSWWNLSLHIVCFISPADCFGNCFFCQSPCHPESLFKKSSPFGVTVCCWLLLLAFLFLLLYLIFSLKSLCWRGKENTKPVDKATWFQPLIKSNKWL